MGDYVRLKREDKDAKLVAVIDDDFDWSHPDLVANMDLAGPMFPYTFWGPFRPTAWSGVTALRLRHSLRARYEGRRNWNRRGRRRLELQDAPLQGQGYRASLRNGCSREDRV